MYLSPPKGTTPEEAVQATSTRASNVTLTKLGKDFIKVSLFLICVLRLALSKEGISVRHRASSIEREANWR